MQNIKLAELNRLYGSQIDQNILNKRFVHEERVTILLDSQERPSIIYYLSDLLIIAFQLPKQHDTYKYYTSLYLDNHSYSYSIPDRRYLANLVRIAGKNMTITIICENQRAKQNILKIIQDILHELTKNSPESQTSQDQLTVFVLGTEIREPNTFRQYTVYVVEITYHQMMQRIYIRFSELKTIDDFITNKIPSIKLPHFDSKLLNSDSKQIESRKLQIENFLHTLLLSKDFQQSNCSKEALQRLGLPMNFYKLPETIKRQLSLEENLDENEKYLSPKRFNSTNLRISTVASPTGPQVQFLSPRQYQSPDCWNDLEETQNEQLSVTILFHDGTKLPVNIPADYLAIDLFEHIVEKIQLCDHYDFRLYEVTLDKKSYMRPVANDEQIAQILNSHSKSVKFFSSINKKGFILRKYLYLPRWHTELSDYDKSLKVRIKLIVFQTFFEIQKKSMIFSLSDYCVFCALYMMIKYIKCIEEVNFDYIEKVVPADIIKKQGKKDWQKVVLDIYKKLQLEFNSISIFQQQQNSREEGVAEQIHQFNENQFLSASALLIKMVSRNPLFGVSFYDLKLNKNENNSLKEHIKKFKKCNLPQSFMLGISYRGLHIVDASPNLLVNWSWNEFDDIQAYSDSLELNYGSTILKFTTNQSFEIVNLIWEYQYLNQEVSRLMR